MKPPPTEKSYHIFYQMMAGLHPDERAQLGLSHFGIKDLNYLNMGDTQTDEMEDAERFEQWRNSLAILGIPFMDVIRILSAILLLGNVRFTPRYVIGTIPILCQHIFGLFLTHPPTISGSHDFSISMQH